jgi:hypothetical protein
MIDLESRDSLIFNSSPVAVVAIVKIVVSNSAASALVSFVY